MITTDYLPTNIGLTYPPEVGTLTTMPPDWIDGDAGNERPDLAADLDDLKTSLQEHGQLEPVQVYRVRDTAPYYRLRSGHRRHAAIQALGWVMIRAEIVDPPADPADQAFKRLVANLHRRDIDPMSKARTLHGLLAADPALTQEALGRKVGMSQGAVANALRLLELPEAVQALIASGQLTPGHGGLLLRIKEPELRWDGTPTGQSVAAMQIRFATQGAGESVRALEHHMQYWLQDQDRARREATRQATQRAEQDAARTRATAVAAAATERGDDPRAAVRADAMAAATAARATADAAREREQARLADRAAVANATLDRVLGYDPAVPNLEVLRLAARAALGHVHGLAVATHAAWEHQIETGPDLAALLQVLAQIGRATLDLDSDRRALNGQYDTFYHWADARWGLNAAIADDLFTAKLVNARTHQTLIAAAKKRPAVVPTSPPLDLGPVASEPPPGADAEIAGGGCDECGGPTYLDGDSERCPACDDGAPGEIAAA